MGGYVEYMMVVVGVIVCKLRIVSFVEVVGFLVVGLIVF